VRVDAVESARVLRFIMRGRARVATHLTGRAWLGRRCAERAPIDPDQCAPRGGRPNLSDLRRRFRHGLDLPFPYIAEGRPIPAEFTCEGADLSPPLEWFGVPAGTVGLLVTIKDPDAPRGVFHHWAAWDIPPRTPVWPQARPRRARR
jgi:hypothetical protein